jgi:hypothetical protein
LTPTIPPDAVLGSELPHWGYETSYVVGDEERDGVFAYAGPAIAIEATAMMTGRRRARTR